MVHVASAGEASLGVTYATDGYSLADESSSLYLTHLGVFVPSTVNVAFLGRPLPPQTPQHVHSGHNEHA